MTPKEIYLKYVRGFSPMLIVAYSNHSLDEVQSAIRRMQYRELIVNCRLEEAASVFKNHCILDRYDREICTQDEIKAIEDAELYIGELYRLAYGVDPFDDWNDSTTPQ